MMGGLFAGTAIRCLHRVVAHQNPKLREIIRKSWKCPDSLGAKTLR
jgi:hypothetical protein